MASNGRINREMKDLLIDNNIEKNNYSIEQVDESNAHLLGRVRGPPQTPYENGIFVIDITIPENYPFNPPNCRFVTKIWHPNISSVTGAICLDILKGQWAAAMTIASVLLSIQSFLSSPEPSDPQDAVVAHQYQLNRNLYDKTAKYWTFVYALKEDKKNQINKNQFTDYDELVEKLMDVKKVNRDKSLAALSCNDWDLDRAIRSVTN